MDEDYQLESFDLDDISFEPFEGEGLDPIEQQLDETPEISEIVPNLQKRAMVVCFVVDVSGSMRGHRIDAVNDAIRNVIPELKKLEKSNTSAEIRIAVLEFSSTAHWKTPVPVPVSQFIYDDIVDVRGGTNFGQAFAAMNEKFNDNFFKGAAGSYLPLIILMSDGKPTDMGLYPAELERLRKNKWFRGSTRAGIAIEEGALSPECKQVLLRFTENEKNIYEAKNTVILARQIQLVTDVGARSITKQGSVQNSAVSLTAHTGKAGHSPDEPAFPEPLQSPDTPTASPPSDSSNPDIPIDVDLDWEDLDFLFN